MPGEGGTSTRGSGAGAARARRRAWADGARPERSEAFHRVTDILRCKWTIAVLAGIERGLSRPSELMRANPGLTPKVLSQRLKKLVDYGLVSRRVYAEIPPRVEYSFTARGRELTRLIGAIESFAEEWADEIRPAPGVADRRRGVPGSRG